MDTLPTELLRLILDWNVRMCRADKNRILDLRLVCKTFDAVLKPCSLKTVQLEFSRFQRQGRPSLQDLARVGTFVEALYMDMMIVRDEEEIIRLTNVFKSLMPRVPEMEPLLQSLRRYIMGENTFDETDFKEVLEDVLFVTPNTKRLRIALPFQVVGNHSRIATLLLATTFAAFAKRDEEHHALETLVIDHISDTTFIDICCNPMDLINFIRVFAGLKNLIISIKRQESPDFRQVTFTQNIWFLIRKAVMLDSLCLIGWNVKRNTNTRRFSHGVSFTNWTMRSLPWSGSAAHQIGNLRFLELKRVDMDSVSLIGLLKQVSRSLKELYLNEVYLKVASKRDRAKTSLWIGRPDVTKPDECTWVAEELRLMEHLKLDIIRATGLGYDDFESEEDILLTKFDLDDPTGCGRSFDQRFVEAVIGKFNEAKPVQEILPMEAEEATSTTNGTLFQHLRELDGGPPLPENARDFDVETFQRSHNTTSHFKRCIDGHFLNKNEGALKELQNIITVADRGMNMLSLEIDRARNGIGLPTAAGGNAAAAADA